MSKGGGGGGTQTTVAQPWSAAVPYLKEAMGGAQQAYKNPAAYYPGQTFVGPTPGEIEAWNTRLNYADQVFGGQAAPKFGDATQALTNALRGGDIGTLSGTLMPRAYSELSRGFGQFGTAGGLDARGALQASLSGTPDYAGAQGAIDAANAPLLRQFNEELIPGLNTRATFLNNGTGGIKTLNRAIPELGQRMSENAQTILNNERVRALNSRDSTAQFVSQGGLSSDQARTSYGLGLGGLVGTMAGQSTGDALKAASLFPTIAQAGDIPGSLAGQFADWGRGYEEQALADQMGRFNYYQGLPAQQVANYMGVLGGAGGLGGTNTQSTSGGSNIAGAAGGALTGASLAQMFGASNPWIAGAAGIGGLLGLFG